MHMTVGTRMSAVGAQLLLILLCVMTGCMTMGPPPVPPPTFTQLRAKARVQSRIAQMTTDQAVQAIRRAIDMQMVIREIRGRYWKLGEEATARAGTAGLATALGLIAARHDLDKEFCQIDQTKGRATTVNVATNAVTWGWGEMFRLEGYYGTNIVTYELRYADVGTVNISSVPMKDGSEVWNVDVFQKGLRNNVTKAVVVAQNLFTRERQVTSEVDSVVNPIRFEFILPHLGGATQEIANVIERSPELADFLAALSLLCPRATDQPMQATSTAFYFAGEDRPLLVPTGATREQGLVTVLRMHREMGIYVTSDIPESKLHNAIKSCEVPQEERILGLVDATVFGSAKNCLLMGLRGIYVHNGWASKKPGRDFCLYRDFEKQQIRLSAYEVSIGTFSFNTAGSSMKGDAVVKMLKDVQSSLRRAEKVNVQ